MKNDKTKKIIIIGLIIVCVLLIGYGIYYLLTNKSEENYVNTNFEAVTSSASKIDQIPSKELDIKVTTDTLPDTDGVLTEIDYDTFKKLFTTSRRSILILTKTGCFYCEAFLPNFMKALSDMGISAYEINMSNLKTGESVYTHINVLGTPTVYIIENGNVVHTFKGNTDTETIKAFLDLYYVR